MGPAVLLHFAEPIVERQPIENAAKEWARLQAALDVVRAATEALRDQIARSANKYDAAIFDAHLMFLNDPEFLDGVRHTIEAEHVNAEWAWKTAVDSSAQTVRSHRRRVHARPRGGCEGHRAAGAGAVDGARQAGASCRTPAS